MTDRQRLTSHGAPRWVKRLLLAALALLAVFILVHLIGGGFGHLATHFGAGVPQHSHTEQVDRPR